MIEFLFSKWGDALIGGLSKAAVRQAKAEAQFELVGPASTIVALPIQTDDEVRKAA